MNTLISPQQPVKHLATEKAVRKQTFLNLHYGNDSLQVMDVYLPANRSADSTKSLILIHGGGWTSGSKEEFTPHLDGFKSRMPGYAIFNINYRLAAGGHLFPAQEEDVKAAIDFIVSKAEDYHVNKESLVLLGVSAGAHLALLQAYKYSSPAVQAVIDYFGPTDLTAMYQQPWHPLVPLALQMITGTTPEKNGELFEASSPINFVTPQTPPTLILHGGKDQVVDISQSKALAQKLATAGVTHKFEIYPLERHGRWYGNASTASFDTIEKFLKENVR